MIEDARRRYAPASASETVTARFLPQTLRAPPLLPFLLALVAGAVDATTFLALFGLFVAQVTGSFVIVGARIVTGDPISPTPMLAIPLFFAAGVVAGLLATGQRRAHNALALSLGLEALLLSGYMLTGLAAGPFTSGSTPMAVLTAGLGLLAMGVQSAAVRLNLRGVPSTNVMTTNTTQLAIDVTQWVMARRRASGQIADAAAHAMQTEAAARIAALAPIMGAFLIGSLAGGVGFAALGFWCAACGHLSRARPAASDAAAVGLSPMAISGCDAAGAHQSSWLCRGHMDLDRSTLHVRKDQSPTSSRPSQSLSQVQKKLVFDIGRYVRWPERAARAHRRELKYGRARVNPARPKGINGSSPDWVRSGAAHGLYKCFLPRRG
jgi:uncharacterized membrane protein YoaK (UPF0700 family)